MNLRDLADHLEACAERLPTFSPRADRLNALADAARDLDELRRYRQYEREHLFHFPLGDIEVEMEGVRGCVREALILAADLRSWAYREVV